MTEREERGGRVGVGEREIGRASEIETHDGENGRVRQRGSKVVNDRVREDAAVYDGSDARRQHTEAITINYTPR